MAKVYDIDTGTLHQIYRQGYFVVPPDANVEIAFVMHNRNQVNKMTMLAGEAYDSLWFNDDLFKAGSVSACVKAGLALNGWHEDIDQKITVKHGVPCCRITASLDEFKKHFEGSE